MGAGDRSLALRAGETALECMRKFALLSASVMANAEAFLKIRCAHMASLVENQISFL